MPQPIDYLAGLQRPNLTAQLLGDLGGALQQRKLRIAQEEQVQVAKDRQTQVDTALSDFRATQNPTFQDYQKVITLMPKERADQLTKEWGLLSKEQQTNQLKFSGQVMAAFNANPEIAITMLERRAEAERNAGDEDEAAQYEQWAQIAKERPEAVQENIGMIISALPGGKDVIDSVTKLREKKPEPRTALVKNLVAAGFTPGTPEFQAEVQKNLKKAPLVQVGAAIPEEQKALAKSRVQRYDAIAAKAIEADEQIASLDIMDATDVETGAFEPMKQAIATFAEGLGVDASGLANVAAGEVYTAEAGKVILRIMSTQKGPQTDNDRKHIAKSIAKLGNRPEANIFINNAARAMANRAIEQRSFYDDWLAQNETLKGVQSAWNKMKIDTPMVSKFVKTPKGLPVFYFEFRDRVSGANPGASEDEIKEAWRNQESVAKGGK